MREYHAANTSAEQHTMSAGKGDARRDNFAKYQASGYWKEQQRRRDVQREIQRILDEQEEKRQRGIKTLMTCDELEWTD